MKKCKIVLKNYYQNKKKGERRGFCFIFFLFSSPQEMNSMSSLFLHEVVAKSCTKTKNLGSVFPVAANIVIDAKKKIK